MRTIPMANGISALVDDEDFDLVRPYKWVVLRAHRAMYAVRGSQYKPQSMRRLVLGAGDGTSVDHINGNGLDNRKCNLRLCTHAENMANVAKRVTARTSHFKGVSFKTIAACWFAQIQHNGAKLSIGYFDEEEDAALAYNRAAERLFGRFARLNDISITEYRKGPRVKSYENMKRGPDGKFVEGRATA